MGLQMTKSGMPEQPCCCTICGSCPTDHDGNALPAIFAEGVDIDWGNSLYICHDCGELIADLMGRATREGFDELTTRHEALLEAHAELEEEYERQEQLIGKIKEGAAAKRSLTTGAKK